ncbi:MAG: P-loop NTPase [Deferribacteraceae bacterium]|jgi:flagellar biosynthesis protein FlhG|nr:P-loop NTPase [Deferribacteraceae bacterium]
MAEIIAIASGKGGVGKSFLSSSLAMSLNAGGHSSLLVDADLGGANLHNFLGYKIPPVGIYNFLREKNQLEEIITHTPMGVDFVAGSGDILGIAHITKVERSRVIEKLRQTPYRFVILDLGAGTSFNTVDLFNLAEKKIVAMNSEPTAIENAYGFIKVALYRYLERFLSADHVFADVNKKLRNRSASYPDVELLISDVERVDAEVGSFIRKFVNDYKIGMVLNIVRFKKELNVFYGFETILKKYLSIVVEKLGFIPYDDRVSESIRLMQPFYNAYPESGTASCINDIRDMVLTKL